MTAQRLRQLDLALTILWLAAAARARGRRRTIFYAWSAGERWHSMWTRR